MGAEAEVARGISFELSRLARTLQSQQVMDLDSDRLLLEVTETAPQLLPKVTHGCVTLVAHTAIGLANTRRGDELQSAVASRDIIGQAKGILMERFRVPVGAAFTRTTLIWKLGRWWHLPSFQHWSE